ncbi:MAG TPA: ORF6N domain-containing protein [Bacteroidetes bacterium]|nr:ORF6N domain-containing protein [Bacteroidota bacterium]
MELKIIHKKILIIRGQKVMLDFDLAELYEVQTKVLNQSVKRNIERFPSDFMFQLNLAEWQELRADFISSTPNWSQIVTSSKKYRGEKYLPFAFTEQGVAMLSGILRSKKAIEVNIAIMRTFVMLRRYALTYDELAQRIDKLEEKYGDVHEVMNQLLMGKADGEDWENRERIGFRK